MVETTESLTELRRTMLLALADPDVGGLASQYPAIYYLAKAAANLNTALLRSTGRDSEVRLIDTHPQIGELTETIALEMAGHRFDMRGDCACGDAVGLRDPEAITEHVAAFVDYRLTATDGDA